MMTTTTAPAPNAVPASSHLAGTATLVRLLLRRDRVKLPAWTGGLGLFVVYLVAALPTIAETEEDLRGTSELFQDPVGRLLIGPGYGFEDPTFARLVANGYGLYFMVIAALMSILLVVRHTRLEERSGRAELVRANVVGRHASLTAALVVALITNLVAGVLVFVLMVAAGGFVATGSLLFAASIATVGLAFAGITAVAVQLSEYPRAAAGLAGAGLGAAFALRAVGDLAALGGTGLSWASPLGWGQQTAPFVLDRWWPLLLPIALTIATVTAGYLLSSRRDLSASLFAVRPGNAEAAPSLGTPLGLAFRLQRASIIGWTSALAVTGLLFGAYADALLQALGDMPEAFLELFGEEDLVGGYLAYMALFMAYLGGAYVVLAVQGYRTEETSGRGEPLLSTPISRWTWLGSNLAVTAGAIVVIMSVTGLATGLGAAIVTGDAVHIGEMTLAHLNQVPALSVVLGSATLLFGVLPRAVAAAWAFVGYGMFAGTFGPLMELPQAAANLSPFEHAAEIPVEDFALTPVLLLLLVAVGTALIGLVGTRHRDLDLT